ncbi:MAG: hypothetical protein DHS20C16_35580 [Phycisphaerae bacterium]|nr:MAG: hypothetical protein DHS20C16_35580 [Phycisphaerae bacterium]
MNTTEPGSPLPEFDESWQTGEAYLEALLSRLPADPEAQIEQLREVQRLHETKEVGLLAYEQELRLLAGTSSTDLYDAISAETQPDLESPRAMVALLAGFGESQRDHDIATSARIAAILLGEWPDETRESGFQLRAGNAFESAGMILESNICELGVGDRVFWQDVFVELPDDDTFPIEFGNRSSERYDSRFESLYFSPTRTRDHVDELLQYALEDADARHCSYTDLARAYCLSAHASLPSHALGLLRRCLNSIQQCRQIGMDDNESWRYVLASLAIIRSTDQLAKHSRWVDMNEFDRGFGPAEFEKTLSDYKIAIIDTVTVLSANLFATPDRERDRLIWYRQLSAFAEENSYYSLTLTVMEVFADTFHDTPDAAQSLLRAARIYDEKLRYSGAAIQTYQRLLAHEYSPEQADVRQIKLRLAKLLYDSNEYGEAYSVLINELEASESLADETSLLLLAMCEWELGFREQCETHVTELVREADRSTSCVALLWLGASFKAQGDLAKAREYLELVTAQYPGSAQADEAHALIRKMPNT